MTRVVLRCAACGHTVTEARAVLVRRTLARSAATLGAEIAGPFCVECKKAGRPDAALVETTIEEQP